MNPLPWRLRIADFVVRLGGPGVTDLDSAGIARRRSAAAHPVQSALWRLMSGPVVPRVRIEPLQIPGRHGTIAARVYRPAAADGRAPVATVIFFHGGGWVFGAPSEYDPFCSWLADAAEVLIVSIDYRLAPEHVAPAGLQDALDATRWIGEHVARLGGDPERLGVMGDSAGGNLAAVVTQQVRDEGGPTLRHQVLIYPSVDSTCLRRSKIEHARGPLITRRDTDTFFRLYRGSGADALDPADPRISPLQGDLRGLPPALIQTAALDPLRDEGRAYADKLRRSGVQVLATDYPNAAHGFASMPALAPSTWAHRSEIRDEIRRHLAGGQVIS
ncbi:alpha/beta hydrolase [Gephyromycinifex aptenodytis]|uniref:alpha/beta hydrolase n=1 Tax=Gephyromycinifex aptenodytis TaxID=2716227 RepID=UPI001445C727|nr:alpha/beta hydrolase [Gephyromycinifex aptenodytis]